MSDSNNNQKFEKSREDAYRTKDDFRSKSTGSEKKSGLIKPKNATILAAVIAFAFLVQVYRELVLKQFRSLGVITPGHIHQPDIGRNIVSRILVQLPVDF